MGCLLIQTEPIQQPGKLITLYSKYILWGIRPAETILFQPFMPEAKNQMALAQIKTDDFCANSVLFQSAILAYNTVRYMALLSGNSILGRWEPATIRTFLIRMAGKFTTGSRQQKIAVPERMLYAAQWDAWVAVGEI